MDSTERSIPFCDESNVTIKSRLNVQSDWNEVLRVAGEKAWISCTTPDQPSMYGEITAHEQDCDGSQWNTKLETSAGFKVQALNKKMLLLSHVEQQTKSTFVVPSAAFAQVHKKNIQCIDVSPGGGLGVSSGSDGELRVWHSASGKIRHELEGHISDVTTCRFFPSGQVVLSGGADMRLKIWSIEDGSCPVTLKGHTAGIADTAIIDKGRNVVSCGRDGTARLWDCGEAKCLSVIARYDCPVNSCALGVMSQGMDVETSNPDSSEREIGTEGKLLALALEDGTLHGVCLRGRNEVFSTKCSSALSCCVFISDEEIIAGSDKGRLYHWDCRNLCSPISVLQRSKSPITSVYPNGPNAFFVSTADGTCFRWNTKDSLGPSGSVETLELVGPDCDPVYSVCVHAQTVYTSCRDGLIRKYVLP